MQILEATKQDIAEIAQLFKQYLIFYKVDFKGKDPELFLTQRLENNESKLYYAQTDTGEKVGFAHLYPLFDSLAMQPMWLLNDLYVAPSARCKGVGTALLSRCDELVIATNASSLMLSTGIDNKAAQSIYERHGYKRDLDFYIYNK